MEIIKKLLLENKAWVQARLSMDETFFEKMAIEQNPNYFWIGCCDSRVHPAELVNVNPGEMFVHSNIANQVKLEDKNVMSALEYAVSVLKVKYIIVCGHTQCGGVRAAIAGNASGIIHDWITDIEELYRNNQQEFKSHFSAIEKESVLIEMNVKSQVEKIEALPLIQKLRKENLGPRIHAWCFEMEKGQIKEICSFGPHS